MFNKAKASHGLMAETELGRVLRHWRGVRGVSQLDLALDAETSQRHVSFMESGRSMPSRMKLLRIADALDIPFRERNTLLLAAGYAPQYADEAWDAPGMRPVVQALSRMLRQHEPFPALVLDRYWTVLETNAATPRFFGRFVDLALWPQPRNVLHLIFDPAGLRPHLANWEATARSLVAQVHRESVGRVLDPTTRSLLAALLAYPDVRPEWRAPDLDGALPVLPLSFTLDGTILSYFSLVTTVGTPQTIAAQELRVETMFPADDTTDTCHRALMSG